MSTSAKNFCSDIALQYAAPLAGTATQGDVWFLLEYSGRWGKKAFEESDLHQDVKNYLDNIAPPGVRVRTLLIRNDESRQRGWITFFVGQTSPLKPRLYEFQLSNYTDLLDLDLAAYAAGTTGDPAQLRMDPLYLVCTNGLRDQCCARLGPAVYRSMCAEAGEQVWQSSHIGGHNKAPVLLFFPHGLNYGRVTPDDATALVQSIQNQKVALDFYRGRVCFDPHVQAAEHFWRAQTGDLRLPGMQVQRVTELGDSQWAVIITDADGEKPTEIHIRRRESEYQIPITCDGKKSAPITTFHQIEISQ